MKFTVPILIGITVSATCLIMTTVGSFITGYSIGKDEAERKRQEQT